MKNTLKMNRVFAVCITLLLSATVGFGQKQTDQNGKANPKMTSNKTISKKDLLNYDTLAQKATYVYDTAFSLTDPQKEKIYELNYAYWLKTHRDRQLMDSLKLVVLELNKKIRMVDNERAGEIRSTLVEKGDKESMHKYRDCRKAERQVITEIEMKNGQGGKGRRLTPQQRRAMRNAKNVRKDPVEPTKKPE